MSKGEELYELGDVEAALPKLTEELRENPNDLSLKLLLAAAQSRCHEDLSYVTSAATELKGAIDEAKRLQILGQVEFDLGDRAAGLEHLRQALALEPENVHYMVMLSARCNYVEDCEEEARELFENVIAAEPNNVLALVGLGGILGDSEADRAIELCRRGIELDNSGEYWRCGFFNLARALHVAGAYEQAIEAYDRVVELGDPPLDAYLGMASCLIAMGKPDEAVKWLDLVEDIDPASKYLEYLREYLGTIASDDTVPGSDLYAERRDERQG